MGPADLRNQAPFLARLVHVSTTQANLAQLLVDLALRLHLELVIIKPEDWLRLWFAVQG